LLIFIVFKSIVNYYPQKLAGIIIFAERPNSFAKRPNSFAERPNSFAKRPNSFAERPNSFAERLNSFAERAELSCYAPVTSLPEKH
jgi:hypothetical protein